MVSRSSNVTILCTSLYIERIAYFKNATTKRSDRARLRRIIVTASETIGPKRFASTRQVTGDLCVFLTWTTFAIWVGAGRPLVRGRRGRIRVTYDPRSRRLLDDHHARSRLLLVLHGRRRVVDEAVHVHVQEVLGTPRRQRQGHLLLLLRLVAEHVVALEVPDGLHDGLQVLPGGVRDVDARRRALVVRRVRGGQPLHLDLRLGLDGRLQDGRQPLLGRGLRTRTPRDVGGARDDGLRARHRRQAVGGEQLEAQLLALLHRVDVLLLLLLLEQLALQLADLVLQHHPDAALAVELAPQFGCRVHLVDDGHLHDADGLGGHGAEALVGGVRGQCGEDDLRLPLLRRQLAALVLVHQSFQLTVLGQQPRLLLFQGIDVLGGLLQDCRLQRKGSMKNIFLRMFGVKVGNVTRQSEIESVAGLWFKLYISTLVTVPASEVHLD